MSARFYVGHPMRLLIPALLLLAPAPLLAQAMVQPLPGTTDADRLAEQMRALATNPRDINALIAAADLSLGLGDLSGAASLLARAEKVSPADPRIKAGQGAILVRSERPGEALRYFAQAEAAGLSPATFAADRGLAYDLIGEQERAQRDYRLALKNGADAEVAKRYALSLGISGKRDAALEQLDPLLRTQDHSAWRIRAFVLAMVGDQAGAEKIATTMLPPGMAQGLQPFFLRLPTLPASDRAFAVHFGEVHATPERIADARLAPAMSPLAPEPQPVMLAANNAVSAAKKNKRGRGRDRTAVTATAATVVPARKSTPVPVPPPAPVVLAQVQPLPAQHPTVTRQPAVPGATAPLMVQPLPAQVAVTSTRMPTPAPVTVASSTPAGAAPAPGLAGGYTPDRTASPAVAAATVVPTPNAGTAIVASNEPARESATLAATPPASPPPARVRPQATARAVAMRDTENLVLARIIAGLSIPASELGVAEPARPAAVPVVGDAARVLVEAKAKEARDAQAEKALALKALADKRAADRKAIADRKALAAKKVADAQKLADAKEAAEERKASRANPARIWVQVAGGANEGDLAKAWAAVRAKAPAALAGRHGWTTPLRATNRVLTGPFKTGAEARAFVNQLTKAGVSSFSFTSDAGQVVERLPGK